MVEKEESGDDAEESEDGLGKSQEERILLSISY